MMRNTRGITLLELMMVMVILALLMSITLPRLRGAYAQNELQGEARRLATLMRYARNKAVLERKHLLVQLNPEKGFYSLKQAELEEDAYGKEETTRNPIEGRHFLAPDVWFKKIQLERSEEHNEEEPTIAFFPEGSAQRATIVLENKEGRTITIETHSATGKVEAYRGTSKKEKSEQPYEKEYEEQ